MVAHTFVVGGKREIRSQRVIDKLVGLAFGGDNVVKFWTGLSIGGLMVRWRLWLTHHPRTAAHCLRCMRPQIPLLKYLVSWSNTDSTDDRSVCRV